MTTLPLIVLLPAAGALINGVFGIRFFGKRLSSGLACATLLGSLVLSVRAVLDLIALEPEARAITEHVANWMGPIAIPTAHGVTNFQVGWDLRLDPLSGLMALVVTGIGLLIHVYAAGYMMEERSGSYARFFCYLNLFVFFMLLLVLGANFLVMFVGWEGVGLCSYLLIGFWYEKPSAANAGKKAFLVNRIGDFGFLLGMFLLFDTFGTLDFRAVANAVAAMPIETAAFGTLSLAAALLFVGATGKSAQIPLYVWLPDAMEGPTPVSALIHAATMVTAGVYMVCRNAVLFEHAPMVLQAIAVVGVLTALVAASIGLVQNDIKRVLAYSTVSQLGYMFLATGLGAFAAAAFHLMTHAFFKALLFLGSGSVIHAMGGEQDMRRMGSLRRMLPVTFATMMVGTLAIAGVPPFSGFFSKDEILARAFVSSTPIWAIAAFTAAMTAFYMCRLMVMTFYGTYRGPAYGHTAHADGGGHGAAASHDAAHHAHGWHGPHESPLVMTAPLVLLAVGAALAGLVGVPAALGGSNRIERFLEPSFTASAAVGEAVPATNGHGASEAGAPAGAPGAHDQHLTPGADRGLMLFSVLTALTGMWLAWQVVLRRPERFAGWAERLTSVHRVLLNKYYVDEAYGAGVVAPTLAVSRGLWSFDRAVVDGAVNFSGWATRAVSVVSRAFDTNAVDGLVNRTGNSLWEASFGCRRFQTGLIQNYALLMVAGVVALVSCYLLLR